jgi:hypothetical protein
MTEEDILKGLKRVFKGPLQTVPGEIVKVNEDMTVEVLTIANSTLPDVRLRAAIDGVTDGVILWPKQGSSVLVTIIGNDEDTAFVSSVSEVDKVEIRIGSISFFLTKDEITMNDGSLGGLVKIADLVGKLNVIEQDINNLKTVFSTWVPVPNDGGAALKTASGSWSGSQLAKTLKTDLEDTKITH